MVRNTVNNYGLVTIAIHWLSALTIIALFGLGIYMVDLSYYDDWYKTAPVIHKSIGMLLVGLIAMRIFWKAINVSPQGLDTHSNFERIGAKITHHALYGLMSIIMISGYLISTANGKGIEIFETDILVPALIFGNEGQSDFAGEIHFYAAWTLMILALFHGLAAVKHHIIDKDITLSRMINPTTK